MIIHILKLFALCVLAVIGLMAVAWCVEHYLLISLAIVAGGIAWAEIRGEKEHE